MSDDKAVPLNVSIRETQAEKINLYLKHHKHLTVSRFFQNLIDGFFNKSAKDFSRDFIMYICYPLIIISLLIVINVLTQIDVIYYATGGVVSIFFYSIFAFTKKVRSNQ